MVSVLERGSSNSAQPRRAAAQAVAALCIGGMVVARAIADRALADELREACMAVALRMGGWDEMSPKKLQASEHNPARNAQARLGGRRADRRVGNS
jgi:hypothetical protein